MWSFRRSGGNGTEQPSSDAMAVRVALPVSKVSFFSNINRKATQRSGRLSERKKEPADMELSPPGGSELASSGRERFFFFLY